MCLVCRIAIHTGIKWDRPSLPCVSFFLTTWNQSRQVSFIAQCVDVYPLYNVWFFPRILVIRMDSYYIFSLRWSQSLTADCFRWLFCINCSAQALYEQIKVIERLSEFSVILNMLLPFEQASYVRLSESVGFKPHRNGLSQCFTK